MISDGAFIRINAILLLTLFIFSLGQASAPDAEIVGLYTKEVANTAWEIASKSNLKPTNQNTAGSSAIGGSGKRQYSTDAAANQKTGSSMGVGSAEADDAGTELNPVSSQCAHGKSSVG